MVFIKIATEAWFLPFSPPCQLKVFSLSSSQSALSAINVFSSSDGQPTVKGVLGTLKSLWQNTRQKTLREEKVPAASVHMCFALDTRLGPNIVVDSMWWTETAEKTVG